MKARLSIQQLELEITGGSGRVITAEATGSENVREALRMVTSAMTEPLARRTDPQTSHAAAARAALFTGDHETRILAAIDRAGAQGATAKEIATATGLTDVQVNRRLCRMGERRLIERRFTPEAERPSPMEFDYQKRGRHAIWWRKVAP
jgi:DNA-binding MarR family transcriptional regulator